MHRMAAIVFVVMLALAAVPAWAADETAETKALQEQVKSLQDANVVMKEDLAKTQLQLAEMAARNRAQAEAAKHGLADLAKQLAEMRAAHEAALQKAEEEAAAARRRAKNQRMWLYVLGGVALAYAASN